MKIITGFPFEGEVFDYWANFKDKTFSPWTDLVTEFKYDREVPYFNILVPTADTVKYKYIIGRLIKAGKNCLLSGETGVGKSVVVSDFTFNVDPEKFVFSTLNFSAQTSSKNLQDLFMDKDKF